MSLTEHNYSDIDQAVEAIHARDKKASDELLALLCRYHPEQCPSAARAHLETLVGEPDEPEPAPTLASLPNEDDRIAIWVERQKALLPPKFRDWNAEASGPTILSIQRAICAKYGISRADIISSRRTGDLIEPRQVAIYLSRKMTSRSLPYIGGKFGGRDHSTALHAVRKITQRMERDPDFAIRVDEIQKEIERQA